MADYNGWANWQTWNVALWLNNDESHYRAMRARRAVLGSKILARDAEEFARDVMPGGTPDMDNGAAGYRGVRWSEIARVIKGD